MNALDIHTLSFAYGSTYALEEVSFSVKEGAFVGVFGPNGGGKTTLLHLILGFLKPTRGNISVFGKSPKQAHAKIGWVPQTFHFDRYFPISVEEVVLGGRLSHLSWRGQFSKLDREAVSHSLEKVGMKKFINAPFAALSGGQAQRVLIARALVSSPSLLILDEPTASVDYQAQIEIYNMLKQLKGKMTILMVTHDLDSAVEYVDTLFCVQRSLTEMSPKKVCEHFALGLYHSPLKKESP